MNDIQQQNSQAVEQHSSYVFPSDTVTKIVTYDDRYPWDVLKWIKYNAPPRQSLKLMKVCKYFKHKNFPFFTVRKIENINHNVWEYWTLDGKKYEVDGLENLPNNLWITKKIRLYRCLDLPTLFRKITVCDIKYLILHDCSPTILFQDFKLLTSSGNVEEFALYGSVVKYENGDAVPFEAILECLPSIVSMTLNIDFPPIYSMEAANAAVSKAWKYFEFTTNFEMSHFGTFATFMIQNQQIEYFLSFEYSPREEGYPEVSQEYVDKIEGLIVEIIKNWSPQNSPPLINFTEQLRDSYEALNNLHHLHFVYRTTTSTK
uniref:Uncharacterized protein n=1 Tax=Panagrolaimus sp. ES5 TaxID=591445 RepID=A0AC34FCG2_9BILA